MYEEIWKDIAGYEGIYQVSRKGRIKILARRIQLKSEEIGVSHALRTGHLAKGRYEVEAM